jgi:hypothetical protein
LCRKARKKKYKQTHTELTLQNDKQGSKIYFFLHKNQKFIKEENEKELADL